jgi:hypothetical protein
MKTKHLASDDPFPAEHFARKRLGRAGISRFVAAVALAIFGALGAAHCSILVSDNFNYSNGCVTAVSGGLWVAHSQPGYGCVMVSGGQLRVDFWDAEDVSLPLPGAPYDTVNNSGVSNLYSQFTMTCIELPTTPYGAYFFHFKDSGIFYRDRVWAMTNGAPLGMFRLAASGTNSSGAAAAVYPMDLAPNTPYTVVTRLDLSSGSSMLWINPSNETDFAVTSPQPDAGRPMATAAAAFRQFGRERGVMLIGNLQVGTSFSDVIGNSTPPVISAVPPQTTAENMPVGPIPFMVQSARSAAGSLLVTAVSANPAVIPSDAAHLSLGGSGSNRFLSILPGTNAQGTAGITLTVTDGNNFTHTAFPVSVGAPTITPIPDQLTYSNTPLLNIPFEVFDPDGDPLELNVSSSNPALLPASGIVLAGGGTAPNRTVSLYPVANQTGVAAVTISVTDGPNTNETTFNLAVSPRLGFLLSEPFPYPNGQSLALPGTPWTTTSGKPFQITVANHAAALAYSNTECAALYIPGGPYQPSNAVTLYASFAVNFSTLPFSNGNYCCTFKGTNDTISRGKFWARTLNARPGYLRVGIANFEDTPVDFPMDISLNSTHQVTIAYSTGLDKSALWVDALNEQGTQVVADDPPNPAPISRFVLREAKGIGISAIQNLKFGTSFQDVFTPPPATLSIQRAGANVVLSWSNSLFGLTSRTNLSGADTRIPGATSPYTNPITGPQRYFRLVYP